MRIQKQRTAAMIVILLAANCMAMAYSTGLLKNGYAGLSTVVTPGKH
ncbi:MAG: hypothetical protein JRF02_06265, partial [Deltaproteobacteria bacterium]|nr:hypothetical protein [Deltaproteobacteria bacterium]